MRDIKEGSVWGGGVMGGVFRWWSGKALFHQARPRQFDTLASRQVPCLEVTSDEWIGEPD